MATQGQNEKRSRKQEALEASLRASYDDMLARGLNPYEVQRRQLVEEKYQEALQRQKRTSCPFYACAFASVNERM